MAKKSRYFQVYNYSTGRWVKFDREKGGICDYKETPGAYKGIPFYKVTIKR
jgi:hypothetical protein